MDTVFILRGMLLVGCLAMSVMALHFLHHRRMEGWVWLLWSVLAVGFPVLGPFLVIVCRPGEFYSSNGLRRKHF